MGEGGGGRGVVGTNNCLLSRQCRLGGCSLHHHRGRFGSPAARQTGPARHHMTTNQHKKPLPGRHGEAKEERHKGRGRSNACYPRTVAGYLWWHYVPGHAPPHCPHRCRCPPWRRRQTHAGRPPGCRSCRWGQPPLHQTAAAVDKGKHRERGGTANSDPGGVQSEAHTILCRHTSSPTRTSSSPSGVDAVSAAC